MQGLAAILDKKKRVEDFLQGIQSGEYIMRVLTDNEEAICKLNSETQLYERGIDATGVKIADYAPYKPFTIEVKRAKGQPTDRVTLRDTGAFHKSFYLVVDTDKVTFYASDKKTAKLINKYGGEIFGLTPPNLDTLITDYIFPALSHAGKKLIHGLPT